MSSEPKQKPPDRKVTISVIDNPDDEWLKNWHALYDLILFGPQKDTDDVAKAS